MDSKDVATLTDAIGDVVALLADGSVPGKRSERVGAA